MNSELKIRQYVKGKDELLWINIFNRAMAEFPDMPPLTLEDLEVEVKAPNFDPEGRFIAEWNGKPVGEIHAYIDPVRPEKKGELYGPRVVPEFRRRHIGKALVETAFQSFRARGIQLVQTRTRDENIAGKGLLESFGFQINRVSSRMWRSLQDLPEDVGENQAIKIIQLELTEENLLLQNCLMNETMKEHYNFRPLTMDETSYYNQNLAQLGITPYQQFAYLQEEPVGILISSIDRKEIEHRKKNIGWLLVLGVLKNFRGKGIGKALMIAGMKLLKEKGMDEAELGVDDENPVKAIQIYRKLGFQVVLKMLTYNKDLD